MTDLEKNQRRELERAHSVLAEMNIYKYTCHGCGYGIFDLNRQEDMICVWCNDFFTEEILQGREDEPELPF